MKWPPLFRRTTDLVAIGIVVIGLLLVGGKLAEWWNTDPPAAVPQMVPTQWVQPSLGVVGSGYRLQRAVIAGERPTAIDEMNARLASVATQVIESQDIEAPDTAAERRIIEALKTHATRRTFGEGLALYGMTGPVPTSYVVAGEADDAVLVAWSYLWPSGPEQWTTLLVTKDDARSDTASAPPQLPLPAGAEATLRLEDAFGSLTALHAPNGDAADWQVHFRNWFEDHDWEAVSTHTQMAEDIAYFSYAGPAGRWIAHVVIAPSADGLTAIVELRSVEGR